MALRQGWKGCGSKTNGIPFWGRCTTHFRTFFSGDWDVHWGHGILTHGQKQQRGSCWLLIGREVFDLLEGKPKGKRVSFDLRYLISYQPALLEPESQKTSPIDIKV